MDDERLNDIEDGHIPDWSDWLEAIVQERLSNRISPKARKVLRVIATSPESIAFAPVRVVAERAAVNPATVVRTVQALGFSGYTELQQHARHRYLGALSPVDLLAQRSVTSAAALEPLQAVIAQDVANLQLVSAVLKPEAVAMAAQTIAKAGKTVVIASGTYSTPGVVLSHVGSYIGYDIRLEERSGMHLVSAINNLGTADCLVVISFWHLIKHHVLALQAAKRRGIPTIAITDTRLSALSENADQTLIVPTQSVSFYQSMAAAMSVAYAIVLHLQRLGGATVLETMRRAESSFDELEVVYNDVRK